MDHVVRVKKGLAAEKRDDGRDEALPRKQRAERLVGVVRGVRGVCSVYDRECAGVCSRHGGCSEFGGDGGNGGYGESAHTCRHMFSAKRANTACALECCLT